MNSTIKSQLKRPILHQRPKGANVLSSVLKVERLFTVPTDRDNVFNRVGAATLNTPSPLDFRQD